MKKQSYYEVFCDGNIYRPTLMKNVRKLCKAFTKQGKRVSCYRVIITKRKHSTERINENRT